MHPFFETVGELLYKMDATHAHAQQGNTSFIKGTSSKTI